MARLLFYRCSPGDCQGGGGGREGNCREGGGGRNRGSREDEGEYNEGEVEVTRERRGEREGLKIYGRKGVWARGR